MRMVNAAKRRLLRVGLLNWLRLLRPQEEIDTRFDVVEVYLPPNPAPKSIGTKVSLPLPRAKAACRMENKRFCSTAI